MGIYIILFTIVSETLQIRTKKLVIICCCIFLCIINDKPKGGSV